MTDPDKRTILLVEDEPAVRRSLQLLLQGHGFTVRSYGSESAVLADPHAAGAQGMVTDYRLPDGDGVGLLGRLRTAGFSGTAILMTAFGSDALAKRAIAAGFQRVLDKPLADRVLTVALERALS